MDVGVNIQRGEYRPTTLVRGVAGVLTLIGRPNYIPDSSSKIIIMVTTHYS